MAGLKTRIVFTVTNDLSYDQRMGRIGRSLAAAGYDVTLIGFRKPGSVPLRNRPFRQRRFRLFFRKGKVFYVEYNLRLFFHLLFTRCDVVGAVDVDTMGACWAAARLRRRPLVFDAHEYFSELPEVVGRAFVGRFWRLLEGFLLQRSRHNYTVSRSVADALEARYGQPFRVFPNWPEKRSNKRSDAEEGDSPTPPGELFYQGALNRGRGLETAIRAVRRLEPRGVRLRLAGEGDLSGDLRRLAETEGAPGRIEFLGYLEPEALREATRSAWTGLNLLENRGLSYYYSLSNKFFDYLHAGVPQIAMDFPEYRRINRRWEVAVLLSEASPETVAGAVASLMDDPEHHARLRANCLRARAHLHWGVVEPALISFYGNLALSAP